LQQAAFFAIVSLTVTVILTFIIIIITTWGIGLEVGAGEGLLDWRDYITYVKHEHEDKWSFLDYVSTYHTTHYTVEYFCLLQSVA